MFSPTIVPLLCKFKKKLSIEHPPEKFMRTVSHKIKPERINTLCLEACHFERTMKLAFSDTFKNVQSLTIDKLEKKNKICDIKRYIPNLIYLSTRYENEVDFHTLSKIFKQISNSVKRFEIYCRSIRCSHHRIDLLYANIVNFNTTIESIVLNVDQIFFSLVNKCGQHHRKCELKTITDFIKIMSNIRYVCVILNKGNVETLLDVNEWVSLVTFCNKLDKIKLKMITKPSKDTQIAQKIQDIENQLHTIRESIKFEVKVR